jgi:FixJ family two-component response regulator
MDQVPAQARIGLIDDDLSVRRAIRRLLRTHGYTCQTYESAEAALTDPAFPKIDLAIIDIQLGGMNGFEFCDRLRLLDIHIPHIFITAHLQSDVPDRLKDSILLAKPFEENALIDSIKKLMAVKAPNL